MQTSTMEAARAQAYATPLERISGILRIANQQDQQRGMRLRGTLVAALDATVPGGGGAPGWRKGRMPDGTLDPRYDHAGARGRPRAPAEERLYSAIQDANARWRQLTQRYSAGTCTPEERAYIDTHFPGFPDKHREQDAAPRALRPPAERR